MQLENYKLNVRDSEEIEKAIKLSNKVPPTLEEIWQLMDKVWDKIDRFHQHPVWKLNGLFIEQHALSVQHRHAISDWICLSQVKFGINKIVDYGGGFGTLAKLIGQKDSGMQIDILEQYPIEYAKTATVSYPNIRFVKSLFKINSTKQVDEALCTAKFAV